MTGMNIAWFGSSLVSAYWNGAATYYRGIIRALAARGHRVTFYEPDAFERQAHRDIADPPWARVEVYPATIEGALCMLDAARGADLVVKTSGVGVLDGLLEAAVLDLQSATTLVAFWDVDAPATLDRMQRDPGDPLRTHVPCYDLILTYGGGPPVVRAYLALGARACVPVYNALDPDTHHPVAPQPALRGALGFLGNRLPDREERVERFFFRAARALPGERFVLGGNGWHDKPMPGNVAYLGHVYTSDHNAFNCSTRAVLNICRESMARYGFSPATRVFEAAGAGACIITDAWEGIENFLEPGHEVLVARDGDEVAAHVDSLGNAAAAEIGRRARRRILAEHTYAHRAADVESALDAAAGARAWAPARYYPDIRPVSSPDAPGKPGEPGEPGGPGPEIGPGQLAARPLDIVIFGLSITSSWGNGHATTYRALVRALVERGHRVLFLERDAPWYAAHRDLPEPPYGRTVLYRDLAELRGRFTRDVERADLVLVGSYVREGVDIGAWVTARARGRTAFYDIDTPVTMAKLAARDYEYLSPDLIPRYDLYLSFTGGPILERIVRQYGAARALPLYCSVDPAVHAPARWLRPRHGNARAAGGNGGNGGSGGSDAAGPSSEVWTRQCWDLGYMGTYSQDRQPALERLLLEPARRWREGRFFVAGPQYSADIVWPDNVARAEHVSPADHASFYNAQRFTLNVTRRDMAAAGYSPSVRLFEAAACGTPIISDAWEGLDSFFTVGREILVAHSAEEVCEHLTSYDEERRIALGARARARVLAEHTAAHRAGALEGYVADLSSTSRSPAPAASSSSPSLSSSSSPSLSFDAAHAHSEPAHRAGTRRGGATSAR
jgi:spore maturation protein CgeB